MCRPVRCGICGKTTWAGYGEHIAHVKAQVPPSQWCDGTHTTAEKTAAQSPHSRSCKVALTRSFVAQPCPDLHFTVVCLHPPTTRGPVAVSPSSI